MSRGHDLRAGRSRPLGFALLGVGVAVSAAALTLQTAYVQKSGAYQMVRKNPQADLFGDSPFDKVGEPKVYVVEDQSLVLQGV